ncbi:hypothetical protein [Vagococcus fluvialis]|uniref:hypothetical protein n=1 Tax=Vagococcus fluvialis TaxID=2738 RepID=UPI001A8ED425|nr:hypothetical protein [Vagococcus fluvialis]MBO0438685.1 hypothetical protein [Vagococcus fluvialis]
MESINEIESFIRDRGCIPNSNYFVAEKSWRPSLQLRGSGSHIWTIFSRKPHLLIFTEQELIIYNYFEKKIATKIISIPLSLIKNFSIEKLTPFKEYCLSFEYGRSYYFYIESKDSFFNQMSTEYNFSLNNFYSLLNNNFHDLLKK